MTVRARGHRGRSLRAAACAAACLVFLHAARPTAAAQTVPSPKPAAKRTSPRAPRFELAVGASWLGGYDLGAREATLTGNALPAGSPVVLFRTESETAASTGIDVRFGTILSRTLSLEAALAYARPTMRTSVSGDLEGSPATTVATGSFAQYVFEGALVVRLPMAFAAGRVVPFVSGGAGYLRQLAERNRVVEEGALYHAGGGLRWSTKSRAGVVRGYGARMDARVNARSGGLDVADRTRLWPSLGGALFVVF